MIAGRRVGREHGNALGDAAMIVWIVWSVIITLVVYFSAACWGFVLALPTMVEHDADEADTPLGDAGVDTGNGRPRAICPRGSSRGNSAKRGKF